MTQNQMILQYMKDNGGITQGEATYKLGCTRLSARIMELRRAGHKIHAETVYTKNRYGKPTHYAKYRLEGE